MQVKVKSLTGMVYKVDVEDDDTAMVLKQRLQEKMGVSPDQVSLVANGRVVADDAVISKLDLDSNAMIHAVINLRGGC